MRKSEKLIDRIIKDKIKPTPRWVFVLKRVLVSMAFILSVIVGSMAFSVILLAIQQTDFNVISHLSHSRLELFLGILPFIWVIALIIFLVSAVFFMQKSKKGYKINRSKLVGFSTAISILLGTLFFISGGSLWLEKAFANRISIYEGIQEKKLKIWMNPEQGFLSGTIKSVSEKSFELIDFDEKLWIIEHKDAFVAPVIDIEVGEEIKMEGKKISGTHFLANDIMPWGGRKHRQKMKKRHKKRK